MNNVCIEQIMLFHQTHKEQLLTHELNMFCTCVHTKDNTVQFYERAMDGSAMTDSWPIIRLSKNVTCDVSNDWDRSKLATCTLLAHNTTKKNNYDFTDINYRASSSLATV